MKKYKFYIETGYAGCNYEEILELDDDITEKSLEEIVNDFLINHIDYGYYEVSDETD